MTNHKTRIELTDNVVSAITKMAEGNPGAATVLTDVFAQSPKIDPDCMTPFLNLLTFDTHGIYGSRIWLLYKDVCGENMTTILACLRAVQLGLMREDALNTAINNVGSREPHGLNLDEIYAKVKERLTNFDKQEAETVTVETKPEK